MGTSLIRPGTAEDLRAIGRVQSDEWRLEDYLAYQIDVAEVDGEIVAFLVTRRLAEDEAEVLNIAVSEAHRRQGLASRLLQTAFDRWPGRWFLEVRASNLGAQICYQNLGFRRIGVRPGYYPTKNGKSAEEGIVMEKGK